ncbi:hypothetical protein L2E47_51770, partial [Pseudomonas aeruginosa]|nr:hypothetical protein [Pseudomonas aeruginosa]
ELDIDVSSTAALLLLFLRQALRDAPASRTLRRQAKRVEQKAAAEGSERAERIGSPRFHRYQ